MVDRKTITTIADVVEIEKIDNMAGNMIGLINKKDEKYPK